MHNIDNNRNICLQVRTQEVSIRVTRDSNPRLTPDSRSPILNTAPAQLLLTLLALNLSAESRRGL